MSTAKKPAKKTSKKLKKEAAFANAIVGATPKRLAEMPAGSVVFFENDDLSYVTLMMLDDNGTAETCERIIEQTAPMMEVLQKQLATEKARKAKRDKETALLLEAFPLVKKPRKAKKA